MRLYRYKLTNAYNQTGEVERTDDPPEVLDLVETSTGNLKSGPLSWVKGRGTFGARGDVAHFFLVGSKKRENRTGWPDALTVRAAGDFSVSPSSYATTIRSFTQGGWKAELASYEYEPDDALRSWLAERRAAVDADAKRETEHQRRAARRERFIAPARGKYERAVSAAETAFRKAIAEDSVEPDVMMDELERCIWKARHRRADLIAARAEAPKLWPPDLEKDCPGDTGEGGTDA